MAEISALPFKSDSYLVLFALMKALKKDEQRFLLYLKRSFRSKDI